MIPEQEKNTVHEKPCLAIGRFGVRHRPRFLALSLSAVLAAAGVVAAVSPGAATAASQSHRPALDPLNPRMLVDPPMSVRPKFRWWWTSPLDPSEVSAELNAIANQGFGGVEITFDTGSWATQAERQALATALRTARSRKLELDMTMGAAWPVTTPNTGGEPASPNHSQELMYGTTSVVGPGSYVVPVPQAQDHNLYEGGGFTAGISPPAYTKLVAVTAARVVQEGTPVLYTAPAVPYQPLAPSAPVKSTVLDPSSVVDLTAKVNSQGLVSFSPPAPGHWIIFGLWERPTHQNVMNHLNAAAARAATSFLDANQLGSENQSSLIPGSEFFEDSLELFYDDGIPWTDSLLSAFKRHWGYDLVAFIPALFIQDEYNVPGFAYRYGMSGQLPAPDFEFSGGVGRRVWHDFMQTLTDLYIHNHLDVFAAWARTHRMRFRVQAAYGSPFDVIASHRAVVEAGGIADTETRAACDPATPAEPDWRYALDFYRLNVGGSEQGGSNEVDLELDGTDGRDYLVSLSEYKALMDKAWAAGVTTPVVHGFAYQPPGTAWPGRDQFVGAVAQSWNQRYFPEWPMWHDLANYWARGTLVLRAGHPVQDIAIYRDGSPSQNTAIDIATTALWYEVGPELPLPIFTQPDGGHDVTEAAANNCPPPLFDGQSLEQAGYTYQFIDPQGLLDPRAPGTGVLFPKGPSYRVLVIEQSAMPGSAAQALARDVRRGLAVVIVGAPPSHGTSNADPAQEDAQVVHAFKQILHSPRSRVVASEADVLQAIRSLGIQPSARWSQPVPLYAQLRHTSQADYWYLWNAATKPISLAASFAARGLPEWLDLWTGAITPVAQYSTPRGRIDVPLVLRGGETRVIAFVRERSRTPVHAVATNAEQLTVHGRQLIIQDLRSGGSRFVKFSNGTRRTVTLPKLPPPISPRSWTLQVVKSQPSSTGANVEVQLTQLQDWRQIPQLKNASGTGTYTTTVNLPASWTAPDRGVLLDLGTIWGSVNVYVNGRRATRQATPDQRYDQVGLQTPPTIGGADITHLLRPGQNTIQVVLATTLRNTVEAAREQGNTNGGIAALGATQPYGLIGPVLLRPYGQATVAIPRAPSRPRPGVLCQDPVDHDHDRDPGARSRPTARPCPGMDTDVRGPRAGANR